MSLVEWSWRVYRLQLVSSKMKPCVKIIHARLHAQALTLAALAGAAVVEYYDHK
ncbi:Hypoxia induced protein domain-containing protein [Dioscorea alata]|uniref:Hypoxia induced protein domain-containing protein n=1 Tax=Dioscorea alata TaxID=55571 RepID=A0ACB7V0P0_DIOAL|nr:Hypoxia induced protein domain-containing protein [Dioscorea alata]